MKYKNTFHLMNDLAHSKNIKIVLIGGFAVNHYRYSRHTADIDFLITNSDFDKIKSQLKESGYKEDLKQETFINMKNSKERYFDLDFMLIEEATMKEIADNGEKSTVDNYLFTVPSLEHLIALKLHSVKYNAKIREHKDIPDIINLIRINKTLLSKAKIIELCEKFGPKDVFEKIWKN